MSYWFRSVYVVAKLNSASDVSVQAVVQAVVDVSQQAGLSVLSDNTRIDRDTLIVAVGGDGTMLEAMRQSSSTGATAIGVNMGRVGFLTDINLQRDQPESLYTQTFRQFLRLVQSIYGIGGATDLKQRGINFEHRTVLTNSHDPDRMAVNEYSVSSIYSDTMVHYSLKINGSNAGSHRANSVLIVTPTGSTAYGLSAGGSIMMPSVPAIQLVPVAACTLTSRPIIMPDTADIELTVQGSNNIIRADGQPLKPVANAPFVVTFSSSEYKAKTMHLNNWNFFDVLSTKLGWNL